MNDSCSSYFLTGPKENVALHVSTALSNLSKQQKVNIEWRRKLDLPFVQQRDFNEERDKIIELDRLRSTLDLIDAVLHNKLHQATDSINRGANPCIIVHDDMSLLHLAVYKDNRGMLAILFEAGASSIVNQRANNGSTALLLSVSLDQADVLQGLIDVGADVNITHNSGFSPLHQAALMGRHSMVNMLLQAGAEVNALYEGWVTPLYLAVQEEHVDVVERLIENRANLDLLCHEGGSAIHLACETGNAKIVSLLLNSGANVDQKNSQGQKPQDVAIVNGHIELAEKIKMFKLQENKSINLAQIGFFQNQDSGENANSDFIRCTYN